MQIAGSEYGTHKHDGDNTTECLQIIFVNVESSTMMCELPTSTTQAVGMVPLKTRVIIFTKNSPNTSLQVG
jgi:hypothetical protein